MRSGKYTLLNLVILTFILVLVPSLSASSQAVEKTLNVHFVSKKDRYTPVSLSKFISEWQNKACELRTFRKNSTPLSPSRETLKVGCGEKLKLTSSSLKDHLSKAEYELLISNPSIGTKYSRKIAIELYENKFKGNKQLNLILFEELSEVFVDVPQISLPSSSSPGATDLLSLLIDLYRNGGSLTKVDGIVCFDISCPEHDDAPFRKGSSSISKFIMVGINKKDPITLAMLVKHELGHALGLPHTFRKLPNNLVKSVNFVADPYFNRRLLTNVVKKELCNYKNGKLLDPKNEDYDLEYGISDTMPEYYYINSRMGGWKFFRCQNFRSDETTKSSHWRDSREGQLNAMSYIDDFEKILSPYGNDKVEGVYFTDDQFNRMIERSKFYD